MTSMHRQISLPSSLDFAAAKALYAWFSDNRGNNIAINCGDVKTVGALAGQCIIAAVKEWEQTDFKMLFTNTTHEFFLGLETLGFDLARLGVIGEEQC